MTQRALAIATLLLAGAVLATAFAATKKNGRSPMETSEIEELERMSARFAPTELVVDTRHLSAGDRKALATLIAASRVVDTIFMKQLWSGNLALEARLEQDRTPLGRARLQYFRINRSPWSSLDDHRAFLAEVPARKPQGASFYPEDMIKEEFENWVMGLPEAEKSNATGFFTVIRRKDDRTLASVPYSREYEEDLDRLGSLLKKAAGETDNATLRTFLNQRADALATNDYYASDVAWMDLDAPIDVTLGPYETYNDEVFGAKAAFEAYVSLRDDKETNKVQAFSRVLQEIENNLPIDDRYKNKKLGAMAPIRVVNEVFGAGDGNHGVQTAAYNLPNDERITTERGAKRVMLRNVQEAKFHKVLVPMAKEVLAKDEQGSISFDWFFTHILAHELSHGIGPHQIEVGGKRTTPREQLKELYGAIEEAKADVLGLFALQYMIDHREKLGLASVLPAGADGARKLSITYLASAFRSLGFGLHEAHGRGMAVQVNYLLDKGAIVARADGTFAVEATKFPGAVRDLVHDLLMIEATGDYDAASKLLNELAILRPPVEKALRGLKGIPNDIRPIFTTAEKLR